LTRVYSSSQLLTARDSRDSLSLIPAAGNRFVVAFVYSSSLSVITGCRTVSPLYPDHNRL